MIDGFLLKSEIWEERGFIIPELAREYFNSVVSKFENKELIFFGNKKYIIHDVEIKENEYPPVVKVRYNLFGVVR